MSVKEHLLLWRQDSPSYRLVIFALVWESTHQWTRGRNHTLLIESEDPRCSLWSCPSLVHPLFHLPCCLHLRVPAIDNPDSRTQPLAVELIQLMPLELTILELFFVQFRWLFLYMCPRQSFLGAKLVLLWRFLQDEAWALKAKEDAREDLRS